MEAFAGLSEMVRRKTGLDTMSIFFASGGTIDKMVLKFDFPAIPPIWTTSRHFQYELNIAQYADKDFFKTVRLAILVLVTLTMIQVILVTLRQY